MSTTEIIEKIRDLPTEEKREVAEKIWSEFGDELGWIDPDLTPEQVAELDRRAEDALKNPGRGKPVEQVFAEIEERLRAKK